MDCKNTERQISAYLDGELAGEGRKLLEDHLARCDRCRREMEEMEGVLSMLSSALPRVPMDLARAITTSLPVRTRSAPVAFRWGGIAAAVLLAVSLFFVLNRSTDDGGAPVFPGTLVGDFEGHRLLVTSPDGTRMTHSYVTRVREGDILENRSVVAARLGLDVGVDIALTEGTQVRVEVREDETVVVFEGDGEVIASLEPQEVPFVVEAEGPGGLFRVQAVGTIFGVTLHGPDIEVQVFEGTVSLKAPDETSHLLGEGETWVNGEMVEEEVTPPLWATPALPGIRNLQGGSPGAPLLPGRPSPRLGGAEGEPPPMDLPVDRPREKK